MLAGLFYQWRTAEHTAPDLHYYSEGVMGQIKVIDFPFVDRSNRPREGRALIVNNTLQTVQDPKDAEYDFWPYTRYIPALIRQFSHTEKVLLLGMGGGTMVRRLEEKRFELVDVVEIDQRVCDAAIKYFGLSPAYDIIVDDARHYLKVAPRTYGAIIYDTFKGESAPEHLITVEGLEDAKKILDKDGIILINFYGYLDGQLGKITRSIAKTLMNAGFQVSVLATPGAPDVRNIILMASEKKTYDDLVVQEEDLDLRPLVVNMSDAVTLSDEAPQTLLYAKAAAQWRRLYNQYYTKEFSKY